MNYYKPPLLCTFYSRASQHYSSSKSAPSSQFSSGFNGGFNGYHGSFHGSTSGFNGPNTMFTNGGYFGNRGSQFKGRGRGRSHYQSGPRPYQVQPPSSPGILVLDEGNSNSHPQGHSSCSKFAPSSQFSSSFNGGF